ncbi:MAG: AAA family ATPase [Propioniciclava sp.]
MKVLALLNKKGGAGKTTTAIGLALGLARRGWRVGLVDTDPNGSASRWLATVPDLDTVACNAHDVGALLAGVRDVYDVMVIDSAPNDTAAITAIAGVADLCLVPLAPTAIEVDQLGDTVDLIEQAGGVWKVVAVRVRMSTSAGQTIRTMCRDQGIPVMNGTVPLSEAVARSFGDLTPPLSYVAVVDEVADDLSLRGAVA